MKINFLLGIITTLLIDNISTNVINVNDNGNNDFQNNMDHHIIKNKIKKSVNMNDISINQMKEEIKMETNWNGVNIDNNSLNKNYRSMISQGIFKNHSIDEYDTNYYYPSSAGKDIDIYLIDTGFNFDHPEFDSSDRKVKCILLTKKDQFLEADDEKYCFINKEYYDSSYNHGTIAATVAAGSLNGLAKKANIYGFAVSYTPGRIEKSEVISSLNYIKNKGIKPYQTIINLSLKYYETKYLDENLTKIQELINDLSNMGAIFVAGGGNENRDSYNEVKNSILYPCSFDNVICVGAIHNLEEDESSPNFEYQKASFSNYGKTIDIYAPGEFIVDYTNFYYKKRSSDFYYGTSFSSPLTAGVIATIMSEFQSKKFNYQTMKDYLYEIGFKDVIQGLPEGSNNIFLNNGKHKLYYNTIKNIENNSENNSENNPENKTESNTEKNAVKYISLKFKSKKITSFFDKYLSLKFKNSNHDTWKIVSETEPSFLYLAQNTNEEPPRYCLDLSKKEKKIDKNVYHYIEVVECNYAKYKFMYGISNPDSINVYNYNLYDEKTELLKDKDNDPVCLSNENPYHTAKCKSLFNMKWSKEIVERN
eukprot:jgi/Orpsp1_1/1177383/evm.model.c7180000061259.1